MRRLLTFLLAALLPLTSAPPAKVVRGSEWKAHFVSDLLPFWNREEAWGTPRGAFPTFRCNDGRLPDAVAPCPELAQPPGWIRPELNREYTRMRSRQTYFYGVAFHLTGDPELLALARDGVTWIRSQALDPATGSAISYWESGVAGPPVLHRTSQDLAYAQLGLAMYYYLTRDEAVLQDILRLKEHIFTRYWDPRWGMLRWVVEDGGSGEADRQELVAQLDQINAYLLLLAPILPEPHRSAWTEDLVRLSRVMIERYHDPERHLFWGTLHDPQSRTLGSRHTDFGHTAKALWMIERVGRLARKPDLVGFARREARQLLKQAYLPDTSSWASRLRPDGTLDVHKDWWIYVELDQLAATLALSEAALTRYLPGPQRYWLKHFVDPVGGEVWGWVNGRTGEPGAGLKIHHWKNGYHSAEHALIGYLTAESLAGKAATLHFALPDPKGAVRPYVFSGVEKARRRSPLPGFPGRQRVAVDLVQLR